MAAMARNKGDLWDHVSGRTGKGKPLELEWGVVNNEETQEKIGCGGLDGLYSVLSVVDPELMASVPPMSTARALTRCSIPRRSALAKALGEADAQNPQDFITALAQLQRACGVDALKLSGHGFKPEEFDGIARNARETMGGLFLADPCERDHDGCVDILKKSYR